MEQLKLIPFIFLMIGISAIIGGAIAISLAEFVDDPDKCYGASWTFDSATGKCLNNTPAVTASGVNNLNLSDAYYTITQGQDGVNSTSAQLSTVAIIGVMVIIIGLISSVFVYFKYFY